ncbi:hypothetical protein HLH33_12105 [Gluconacetobacter diazotrophicus]|uniref:Uncharacterized protein n=1 Tax=Gluconacetobacter diazotrophicus TaxID=33996 RepID=A0A7W4I6A3_GLUDI|nr:hypothetical protein [Gluconacetobacter diazotrophicus]MBB2157044.1 hypothetical protein [Gluconacetobacter diazotrophicus]
MQIDNSWISSEIASLRDAADEARKYAAVAPRAGSRYDSPMEDADVRRLEDRIDAVNREGQLRLDASMARMDGKIDAALARIDGKFDRMMASMQHMDQSMSEISSRVTGMRSIIFGTAIASVLAIVGAIFAGQALWASGFSSGQTDRPSISAPAK